MEVQEETMALVIKGKRTKRPRPNSPLTLPMVSTSSSAVESERFSDNSCPTTSFDFATTSTEEEEDMANCLILLAQGRSFERKVFTDDHHHHHQPVENYQCKTCNRCFSSFQALGGHRASHKKPKNVNEEKKTLLVIEEDKDHISQMSTALSLQLSDRASLCVSNNVKVNKVHECSICGAEFSSGQALGGHMRRHRAFISNNTTTSTALSIATSSGHHHHHHHHLAEAKRKRNLLHLDLNLPAPEDDCRESKFSFSSKEQVIVFSASSLVDCHY